MKKKFPGPRKVTAVMGGLFGASWRLWVEL